VTDRPLPTLNCPSCGKEVAGASARRANRFEDCVRRCEDCGIGFSNAQHDPTVIHRDPTMNVPIEFRAGLMEALDQALNVYNRPQKKTKFGFSTSEDAVTWTVFSAIQRSGRSRQLWRALTEEAADGEQPPSVLLWGVPLEPADERGRALLKQIEDVSNDLGEDPRRRTEPDVVIDAGPSGVVIIEAKYMSPNDMKPPSDRFDRYVDARCFRNPDAAKATGLYELIRNWRFGCEVAHERGFALINLVRHQHLRREEKLLSSLIEYLTTGDHRKFAIIEWEWLINHLELARTPDMQQYVTDHFR
jgi:hypothetical protein